MIEQGTSDLYPILTSIIGISLFTYPSHLFLFLLSLYLSILDLSTDLHLLLNEVLGLHEGLNEVRVLLLFLLIRLIRLLDLHLFEEFLLVLDFELLLNQLFPQVFLLTIQGQENLQVLVEL